MSCMVAVETIDHLDQILWTKSFKILAGMYESTHLQTLRLEAEIPNYTAPSAIE